MIINCKLCGSKETVLIESIEKRPSVEVDYGIPDDLYHRSIYQCNICGVYFNYHNLLNLETFYNGEYNQSIDKDGLLHRFNKICSLPKIQSDNYKRVNRVIKYMRTLKHIDVSSMNVLDIGSGTCVFLHEMKKYTENVYCIDPDINAVEHAKEIVKVKDCHLGSLKNYNQHIKFDLISFNKVLEHIGDPVSTLKEATQYLREEGIIYVELPEGDRIYKSGLISQRAEFAMEHLTIYNKQSLIYLSNKAGFVVDDIKIITDPSGKHTVYAFIKRKLNI